MRSVCTGDPVASWRAEQSFQPAIPAHLSCPQSIKIDCLEENVIEHTLGGSYLPLENTFLDIWRYNFTSLDISHNK